MTGTIPPQNGEGDRPQGGGGGARPNATSPAKRQLRRPVTLVARRQREGMSLPEVLIWERLRRSQLGVKFRRQHPIKPYVADFCCLPRKLVIEIDGIAHDMGSNPARDEARDRYIAERGFTVLRISASDILQDIERVTDMIAQTVSPLHHPAGGPPPHAGEDLGA